MDKKKCVLFVLDDLAIGGAQQLVLTLAKGMDQSKFKIVVCTLFSRDENLQEPLYEELIDIGISVYKLGMTTWRDFNTIKKFFTILKKEKVDIVHGHMVPADFWSCLFARLYGAKSIYTRHNTYPIKDINQKISTFILNRFLADKIVSISDSISTNLVTVCKASHNKIIKIRNCIDTTIFNPDVSGDKIRNELSLNNGEIIVGNTSSLQKRKGYDIFIKTAAYVIERHSLVRFVIFGEGNEKKKLQDQIKSIGLQDKIILAGNRRNMNEVMAAIDVFLFTPYWGEGLPLSVLEVMASGKPVVATNIGSNNELIIDGKSGYLPTPEKWTMGVELINHIPLAEKICYLVKNRDIADVMGRYGRELIKSTFSSEVMVKETERLYLSLIL